MGFSEGIVCGLLGRSRTRYVATTMPTLNLSRKYLAFPGSRGRLAARFRHLRPAKMPRCGKYRPQSMTKASTESAPGKIACREEWRPAGLRQGAYGKFLDRGRYSEIEDRGGFVDILGSQEHDVPEAALAIRHAGRSVDIDATIGEPPMDIGQGTELIISLYQQSVLGP